MLKSTRYSLQPTNYHGLPSSPGVYFFRDKTGKILYIGKEVNLKRRVSSYFRKNHRIFIIRPAVRRLYKKIKIRDKIFALKHIQDVALLKEADRTEEIKIPAAPARIEAYDISNIFGQYAVGSMAVFTNGKIDKDEYRRFRIKGVKIPLAPFIKGGIKTGRTKVSPFEKGGLRGISDVGMLKEVLERRLRHPEWRFPDLVIIDGGLGQLNAAKKVLENYELKIPLVSIAKGPTRKGEKLFMTKSAHYLDKKIILALRDEAHRFAISYHRKLKRKGLWI